MQTAVAQTISKMIGYFDRDVHRINHALKVYGFAASIGSLEGLSPEEQLTLEIASILHDIGIPNSERKYGSCTGPLQEQEGPPVAQELLADLRLEAATLERVCYLIGHHHTYGEIDGPDYQILIEADFLVNLFEAEISPSDSQAYREKYFRTPTGIAYWNTMYGRQE